MKLLQKKNCVILLPISHSVFRGGDTPNGRRFRCVLVLWFPKIYGLRKSLRQRSTNQPASQPDGGSRSLAAEQRIFGILECCTGISAFLAGVEVNVRASSEPARGFYVLLYA